MSGRSSVRGPVLIVLHGLFSTDTVCSQLAGSVSFGAFVNMHVPTQAWLPSWEPTSMLAFLQHLCEVPHQLCTRHLVLLGWPAPRRLHASENYNPGGFSVTKTDFPLGFVNFVSDKIYISETVWQYFPPFNAGGQSQGCTSRF